MSTRRSFLSAILAAGVAPAFVGSSVLMPVRKVCAPASGIAFSRLITARLIANEFDSLMRQDALWALANPPKVGDIVTISPQRPYVSHA